MRNSPLSALATVRYITTAGSGGVVALFGFRINTGGGRLIDQVARR
jgi:hypothetical protein